MTNLIELNRPVPIPSYPPMPSTQEILDSLKFIATKYILVAVAWHVFIYSLIIVFVVKKHKPSNRLTGVLLSISLLSVSLFAWVTNNPFNGIVFLAAGLCSLFFFPAMKEGKPDPHPSVSIRIVGMMVLLSGLIYPHFSETTSALFLYAAPTCLIPCPTLLFIIGASLLFDIKLPPQWNIGLLVLGLVYGGIGILKLHVYIDILLPSACLVLAITIFSRRPQKSFNGHSLVS